MKIQPDGISDKFEKEELVKWRVRTGENLLTGNGTKREIKTGIIKASVNILIDA